MFYLILSLGRLIKSIIFSMYLNSWLSSIFPITQSLISFSICNWSIFHRVKMPWNHLWSLYFLSYTHLLSRNLADLLSSVSTVTILYKTLFSVWITTNILMVTWFHPCVPKLFWIYQSDSFFVISLLFYFKGGCTPSSAGGRVIYSSKCREPYCPGSPISASYMEGGRTIPGDAQ